MNESPAPTSFFNTLAKVRAEGVPKLAQARAQVAAQASARSLPNGQAAKPASNGATTPTPVSAIIDPAHALPLNPILLANHIYEVRVPKSRQGTVSGYFDNFALLYQAVQDLDGKVPGIYFSMNPVTPALLARAKNRLQLHAKTTTSDHDILKREWLLIDCDAVRPSEISSTEAEHQAALDRCHAVAEWLGENGWPEPVRADSGNGGHLLFRIDLPNDAASRDLVKSVLEVLALKFNDDAVVIDTTVYNAARITKLYGTLCCKGDSTEDRPHRRSQILSSPHALVSVPHELLAARAAQLPRDPSVSRSMNGAGVDVPAFIARHALTVSREKPWNGHTLYELEACPFNAEHVRSSSLIQFMSGAVEFTCHHNSCAALKWAELRARLEPDRPRRASPMARPESAPEPETDEGTDGPSDAPELDLPPFPTSAYVGIADEIAELYAGRVEVPKEFLYIDTLTFFGTLLGTSVRLDSELRDEPRLFTVKVARSGTDRKSSSQDLIEHFFKDLLDSRGIKLCYGAGSAEGLQKVMETSPSTLLCYDELRAFCDKASVQQSVLLPMVASLFHRTRYQNATKHSEIKLDDAHLSLVSACTRDTFMSMFSPQFRNIGFLNRLFVVTGQRSSRHPIPVPVPSALMAALQTRVRRVVEQAGRERPALVFEDDARARWSDWYLALPDSPYAVRLDTYGLRFLMLFAVTTETWKITLPLVEAVLALLDYQFAVRKELDPVDADGVVARMERLLLRHLSKGRMTESRLQHLCNTRYHGLWSYETAKKNVSAQEWLKVAKVGKGTYLWLTDAGQTAAAS